MRTRDAIGDPSASRSPILVAVGCVALAASVAQSQQANVAQPWLDTLPVLAPSATPLATIQGGTNGFWRVQRAAFSSRGSLLVAGAGQPGIVEYDATGARIRQIGGTGAGPGEFRSISALTVTPEDTLLVLDNQQRRLTVFTPQGAVARTIPLPGTALCCSSAGWYLENTGYEPESSDGYTRARFVARPWREGALRNWEGKLDTLRLETSSPTIVLDASSGAGGTFELGVVRRVPLLPAPMTRLLDTGVLHTTGMEFVVETRALDGRVVAATRQAGPPRRFSPAMRATVRDSVLKDVKEDRDRTRMAAALRDRGPTTYPAIDAVLPDGPRWYWVRIAPAHADTMQTWVRCERNGNPVAKVSFPVSERVVATVLTDREAELERLVVRRLN